MYFNVLPKINNALKLKLIRLHRHFLNINFNEICLTLLLYNEIKE